MVPPLVAFAIRTIGRTLRVEFDDTFGTENSDDSEPVIWLAWHNRVLALALIRYRYLTKRRVTVLSSMSRDGELLARTVKRFGLEVVRGSSSRRGREALRSLVKAIGAGSDVALTPDGPRGPIYVMKPGALKLAQLTGAPVRLIHVEYSKALRLRSWDRYEIPYPFSRIRVVFSKPLHIARRLDEEAFEALRSEVEARMRKPIEASDDPGDH
ncbi:MAG TPA: lysophospholipid acyltransferase family protein [Verrucomicrobiales bacterium]|nr:lysophospholipid acyltransferase family protein [Verrucomicrobiales bacterium]